MSARAPFRPGSGVGSATQPRQQQNGVAETTDGGVDESESQSSGPLNSASLKKLTNKKPSNRASGESRQPDTHDGSTQSVASPVPRAPPTPFGQHLTQSARPGSPAVPSSRALMTSANSSMLPPPPPASLPFMSQAPQLRPQSRSSLNRPPPASQMASNGFQNAPSQSYSHQRSAAAAALSLSPPSRPDHLDMHGMEELDAANATHAHYGMGDRYHHLDGKRAAVHHERDPGERPNKRLRSSASAEPHVHFDNDRRGTSPLSDIAELTPDARHYSTHHSHPQQPPVQMPVPQHPLQSLLEDFDFAAFTSVYAKKYEEDLVKWQKCASEEWEANASVLTQKFADLLDTVKNHMTRKMQLYASLKGVTKKHRSVLQQRDSTIAAERDKLLKKVQGVGE